MFTVVRLGIDGPLAKTLTTSNPIESIISIARTTNRNVTRWPDGQMVLRWTAAGHAQRGTITRRTTGQADAPSRRSPAPARPPRPGSRHRNCRTSRVEFRLDRHPNSTPGESPSIDRLTLAISRPCQSLASPGFQQRSRHQFYGESRHRSPASTASYALDSGTWSRGPEPKFA